MPMIDADGCLLNVSVEGRDGGPTLMLSNSLGCTLQMWEPQMKALTQLFRVIRYDRRGHGKSGAPPGPYSMERFGRDVLAVLDDLNIDKVHWCGLSMGGMVGQWLGANAPERFDRIVLANTACYYADPTNWLNRIKAVQEGGLASVADTVIAGWLTADFRERDPQATAKMKAMLLAILDDLNIDKVHWCGLSMGGMVGQWLGANAPERFDRIVLANTACYYADPTNWLNRIKAVKEGGLASVADTVIAGWLTTDFRERDPQATAKMKAMLLATPVQGYLACCEALSTLDQRALLPQIKSPVLVIAGRHDMATPLSAGELIRSNIPRASLTILDAAHISNVEQSHAFTDAVVGFLTQR